jgi:iron complex transport system substrate-binding protein
MNGHFKGRSLVVKLFNLVPLIVFFIISGCSFQKLPQNSSMSPLAYTVTDSRGVKITFANNPNRIVSSAVFADEILLDLVDHKHIIGISKWTRDPGLSSDTESTKDIKNDVELNTESILKLNPDLVILPDSSKPEFIASLEDIGLKVYVYKSIARLKEIPDFVREIAMVVNEKEKGEKLIFNMNNKLKKVEEQAKAENKGREKEKAILFLRFGAIGGEGTVYHDVIEAVGYIDSYNLVRKAVKPGASRILSKEEVILANPDIIILGEWSPTNDYKIGQEQLAEIYQDPAYKTLNAVKNKKAFIISQSLVNCLSHHAGENVAKLYSIIHNK